MFQRKAAKEVLGWLGESQMGKREPPRHFWFGANRGKLPPRCIFAGRALVLRVTEFRL
jgi:hypothetical protein